MQIIIINIYIWIYSNLVLNFSIFLILNDKSIYLVYALTWNVKS